MMNSAGRTTAMPMIKPASIRDLKQRVNIVDVVSGVVTLRKAGASFKGLGPFHQEKSPSFKVDPNRGTWHCFGACSTGGDVIEFIKSRQFECLDHAEARRANDTILKTYGVPRDRQL